MFQILVADGDRVYNRRLERLLLDAGYEPITVSDGMRVLDLLEKKHIDLILMDAKMPGMADFGLLSQIRQWAQDIPVMVVSEKQSPGDRKKGLRLGADDYMGKPADEEELLLRVAALLRRAGAVTDRKLTVGKSVLVYDDFAVERQGDTTELPRKEFLLLYKLLSHPNKTFTRRQLMDEVWDMDTDSEEHTVVVHVNRLREKLRSNPDFEIITVRGLGYKAVRLSV